MSYVDALNNSRFYFTTMINNTIRSGTMKRRSSKHLQIYKKFHGEIPKDKDGRSYDIHHVNGDHSNNSPENLKAVTLQEHYDIHFAAGDFRACQLIGLRMALPPETISMLSKQGCQKQLANGTHPWQSGKHQKETMDRMVADGTHHFLGGKIQKESQDSRVKQGTHQWCGSASNQKMLEAGTHPSQKEWKCPHCGAEGKGSTNAKRWHFDNCKKGNTNVR